MSCMVKRHRSLCPTINARRSCGSMKLQRRQVIGVVLWLSLALWLPITHCTGSCANGTTIGFKVINTRNSASQWSTEIKFDNGYEVDRDLRWQVQLHQVNSFQCEGVIQFSATLSAPAPREIQGYDFIPGVGYYKMHAPGKNWEEARRTCVREGGHLAIINSELESNTLQLMFARTTSKKPFAFIGFHDHYTEGEYLTIHDLPIKKAGFNRWGAGQPDNTGGDENCGSISRVDGSLNDINCGFDDWPFICEQEH